MMLDFTFMYRLALALRNSSKADRLAALMRWLGGMPSDDDDDDDDDDEARTLPTPRDFSSPVR
jgi:hypothetical protein